MTLQDKFRYVNELLKITIEKYNKGHKLLQSKYENDVLNQWRQLHLKSKTKFSTLQKRQWEFVNPIFKVWKVKSDLMFKRKYHQTSRLNTILDTLAKDYPLIESKNVWRRIFDVDSGTYSTQGFGAEKYARNHAEQDADRIRYTSLPVHIKEYVRRWKTDYHNYWANWAPSSTTYYEIWAPVETEEEVDVLQRKPTIPLKEWIRLCWKRGVNPRVYNPFLPYGLEEKLGLDYFGNCNKRTNLYV